MSSASAFGAASFTAFGAAFDESLGFAEAQAGDGADFLDDVDLVLAERGKDHVEFSLLLGGGSSGSAGAGSSHGDRSGSRNAPLLFEKLRQLGSLENGEGRQVVYEFGEISHLSSLRL
jgi:hypothetical protein